MLRGAHHQVVRVLFRHLINSHFHIFVANKRYNCYEKPVRNQIRRHEHYAKHLRNILIQFLHNPQPIAYSLLFKTVQKFSYLKQKYSSRHFHCQKLTQSYLNGSTWTVIMWSRKIIKSMRQKVYLSTVSQSKIMFMEIPINNKNVYSIPIEPNKLF